MKKAKQSYEKVVKFTRMTPSWTHNPALLQESSSNLEAGSSLDVVVDDRAQQLAPALSKAQRKKLKKQEKLAARNIEEEVTRKSAALQVAEDHNNSAEGDLKVPVLAPAASASSRIVKPYAVPNIPESIPDIMATRGPKLKTRGVADTSKASTRTTIEEVQHRVIGRLHVRAIYPIGKCYETMERLLVRNQGSMDWVDLEKVSANLGVFGRIRYFIAPCSYIQVSICIKFHSLTHSLTLNSVRGGDPHRHSSPTW